MTTSMPAEGNPETDRAVAASAPRASPCEGEMPVDPVTRFLRSRGLATDTAYLGESAFELGQRVRLGPLELVYRFESGSLLVCDIVAVDTPDGHAGAVRALVSLVHAIERLVPEVRMVEGLVPVEVGEPDESGRGRRLLAVYRKLGAQCEPHEMAGMVQVRYRTRGGPRQGGAAQS